MLIVDLNNKDKNIADEFASMRRERFVVADIGLDSDIYWR
ncbi:hypothetical protein NC99_18290 [Sunxiuqinia dokdonensis]|uniref:Uncharacterized protein n=1 Tax=Sunxiuqinia dokdonensis TaxID=1409788 RepID=A0A0L8VAB4_9BACT|nr:hypothetical protein NC99_18290 [Sunxiuqinia dokdonensis]